jgi:hypothetical protein
VRVSIDFTEGRLANKNDSRNPWTGKDLLQDFIDLNCRVIDRFSAAERKNIGVHTCPGGDCDSVHSKDVPYEGYFLIQCASEEDTCTCVFHNTSGTRLQGCAPLTVIVTVDAAHPQAGPATRDNGRAIRYETRTPPLPHSLAPQSWRPRRGDLVTAARYIPVERLGAIDDCGFSPDFARDVAMQKISARLEGARLASHQLGV